MHGIYPYKHPIGFECIFFQPLFTLIVNICIFILMQ